LDTWYDHPLYCDCKFVIGIIDPQSKKLVGWVFDKKNNDAVELPIAQKKLLSKISPRNIFSV